MSIVFLDALCRFLTAQFDRCTINIKTKTYYNAGHKIETKPKNHQDCIETALILLKMHKTTSYTTLWVHLERLILHTLRDLILHMIRWIQATEETSHLTYIKMLNVLRIRFFLLSITFYIYIKIF